MSNTDKHNVKSTILYHVAKAAWEGTLLEQREYICHMLHTSFRDKASRRFVSNQIRIAMGLDPHDSDEVISETDSAALMGISSEHVVVVNAAACEFCKSKNHACQNACQLGAISRGQDGKVTIDYDKCLGDGHCIDMCEFGALAEKSQFVPLINILRQRTHPVYASVAPAFVGQFGSDVTPGKLRSALLKMGFTDMVETALFADLITMKEVFEFDEKVKTDKDFMLTSCCCPVWIKLIENKYPELAEHISPAVSPMVASGRVLKALHPNAKVVFIGPCIAKKAEAQLPDLKGAIDFVLTFQELQAILEAIGIAPSDQPNDEKATASRAGRIYAHTGGVSDAVATTLKRILPDRLQEFIPATVDGIPDCQTILEQVTNGTINANFIEGMACKGGCVGGPGRLIPPEEGRNHVQQYGKKSDTKTPVETPQIYTILTWLGSEKDIPPLTGKNAISSILGRKHLE